MAVGTYQGVAGLAPRPFTLGEETGSHHMVMYIAPACSSACTSGAHLHLPPHRRSSIVIGYRHRCRRAPLSAGLSGAGVVVTWPADLALEMMVHIQRALAALLSNVRDQESGDMPAPLIGELVHATAPPSSTPWSLAGGFPTTQAL